MCLITTTNILFSMSIVLIFLGCIALYAKSKNFPEHFSNLLKRSKIKKTAWRGIGYLFLVLGAIVLMVQYGLATGLVIFLITLMFGLSVTIMFLPLNKKYAYILLGLSLVFIILENSI